jgi:VanZ family protein
VLIQAISWMPQLISLPSNIRPCYEFMTRSFKYQELLKAALYVWAAFVFAIHVVPVDRDDMSRFDFPFADKWIHGVLFFILGVLSTIVAAYKRPTRTTSIRVLLICAAYGASLEIVQFLFTDERSGDFMDWIADLSGTACGLLTARIWMARTIRRS